MKEQRNQMIVRTSLIGIIANVFLSVFKAFIGIMTHSIAITMDAVNNISDAASSLITIVGTKFAGKEPDKKHPFGYGRIEYMSAMVISVLVLYAGVTAFTESVKAILHPEVPDYSAASLVIVAVAVAVKFLLGRYVKAVGTKFDSDALVNSGTDALLDSVISLSTLLAAAVYLIWGLSLEAYLGAVISLVIVKSGVDMMKDTISRILGERVDADMAKAIRDTILTFPAVSGVYDLILHDYGPNCYQGSVHVEVPDSCTANELDQLLRSISIKVLEAHHVILTAIGVYSVNTQDEEVIRIRENIAHLVLSTPYITQFHGFYLEKESKNLRFDLVVSFDAKDRQAVYREVLHKVQERYPDYHLTVTMDTDFIMS